MAFERQWPAVPPRLFTADGGMQGQIQVADTRGFKVGQKAVLSAVGQPNLQIQIKRVMSETILLVGPIGSPYRQAIRTDISSYTVSASSYIFAESQDKTQVPANDRDEATYETEPTVAWRNVLVDQLGRYYETSNPIPVRLTDGSVNIGTVNAEVNVALSAIDGAKGTGVVHDSIRIGDGSNELKVNSDKSIDTYQRNKLIATAHDTIIIANSNASGDPTQILFKKGGLAGTLVQTLNLTYDNAGNFSSVTRTPNEN